MIAVATAAPKSRKPSTSDYNPPKFRARADDPTTGYWYVWHDGKQCQLTAYDAPRCYIKPGSRDYVAQVIPAFHAWIAAHEAAQQATADQAEAERVAAAGPVLVVDVVNNYLVKLAATRNSNAPTYKANAKRLLEAFCTGKDGKGLDVNGIDKYKGYGRLPASAVTKKVIEQWISYHPGWSQTKTALTPIRAAFNQAVEDGLIPAVPFGTLKLSDGQARQDYFSRDEEAAFRSAITSDAFAVFFSANIELGTRPGELASLTKEHVKESGNGFCWRLESHEWKAGKKTGKSRVIHLPAKWVEWTRKRLAEMEPGEFLFTTTNGHQWSQAGWGWLFRVAQGRSKSNPKLVMYSTRHTFITRALLAGWSAGKVAAYCGTSEQEIRRHYGHLVNETAEMVALAESVGAL